MLEVISCWHLTCSLTVEEHLYFYGCLKGMRSESVDEEIHRMISDVELPHKRTALAKDLSGNSSIFLFIDIWKTETAVCSGTVKASVCSNVWNNFAKAKQSIAKL